MAAYSSRVSARRALLRRSFFLLLLLLLVKHATPLSRLQRAAGPERTGSPSGRVVKLGAMRAFSETSRWNANTCVVGREGLVDVPACMGAVRGGTREGREGAEKRTARAGIRTNSSLPPAAGCILCTTWRDAPADLWGSPRISPIGIPLYWNTACCTMYDICVSLKQSSWRYRRPWEEHGGAYVYNYYNYYN